MQQKIISQVFGSRFYYMGLATIAVIFHHLGYFGTKYWGCGDFFFGWFNNGFIGVDIFFYLSLFGLCHSYNNNSLKTFYKRRMRRIYPLWIISYALILAFFFTDIDFLEKIRLFVSHFIGVVLRHSDRVDIEWFLPALHIIYLSFPLLYKLVNSIKKSIASEILFYFIAVCFSFFMLHRFFDNFMWRIPLIFLGITTYIHRDNLSRLGKIMIFTLLFSIMFRDARIIYSVLTPIVLLLSGAIFNRFYLEEIVSFIGRYSLEIYLAQMIVTKFVFRDYFFFNEYFMWIMSIPLIAMISFILHHLNRFIQP